MIKETGFNYEDLTGMLLKLQLIGLAEQPSENNYSKVIYCFDCDKQDSKEDDRKFLEKAKKYCKEHEYEFVWFCKDVEDVYLGKQVDRSEKTKEAVRFKKNNLIKKVDSKNLVAQTYKAKTSNIMKVLDRYEELNRNV